jgi:hypothetical protein
MKAREQLSTDLESLQFKKCFDVCLTTGNILLNKIKPQNSTDHYAIYCVKVPQ